MEYKTKQEAVVLLSDGTAFFGKTVCGQGLAFGEICFNTGTTGYQEIFTDPSYFGQIMVMANAHIGNYGVMDDENESDGAKISALVCRNFCTTASRHGSDKTLMDFFQQNNLIAISDVDTRALVSHIRDNGSMNAVVSTQTTDLSYLMEQLKKVPDMKGLELASKVSTKEPYFVGNPSSKYKVAAIDLGIKKSILENLTRRDVYVKVFPYNTPLAELEKFQPDGYFLSNGPGDPEPLKCVIDLAREIIEKDYPLFGICLGHQIIALASGISTYKMLNGHRGINHPVMNLLTSKGEVTSQNHGFAINKEEATLAPNIEITHIHLNDQTVSGIRIRGKKCFSVQYHPEAGPGPHDAHYLFDQFISLMG